MPAEFRIDRRRARRAFDAAADRYDEAAVLQREVGRRLMDRLGWVRLEPKRILDLGAGTGHLAALLLERYRRADVVAVDFAPAMLRHAQRRGRWRRRPRPVCADAMALPFADRAFDLLVSNLMLQWCMPIEPYLAEMRRVMAPDGLLMFSTFGPDTLKELRAAWAEVDGQPHVHEFIDMHDVGDALLASGFSGPVMDMEMITLTYDDVLSLMRDLKAIGAVNAAATRRRGLHGRRGHERLCRAYERFRDGAGRLPATYEVVYGHAWVPEAPPPSRVEEFFPVGVAGGVGCRQE